MTHHIITFGHFLHWKHNPFHHEYTAHCITAILCIILGVAISSSSFALLDYRAGIRMLVVFAGIGTSIFGLVLCFKESVNNLTYPIEDTVEEHHLYFDKKQKKTLMAIINADGIPYCIKPIKSYKDVVKLDIHLSEDCKFATLQLSQYKSGYFQPLTDVHYYSGKDAKRISELLELYNKD